MRLALIADVFPPLRSSGAVQLRDLSGELARQGHELVVMVAAPGQVETCIEERWQGVRVLRLRTWQTKDVGYVRRTLAEFMMPFLMMRRLARPGLQPVRLDGVIWYSPTIFLGPIVRWLRRRHRCPGYLIIRDIFPEWAVDMGLMGRGLPYQVFRQIARYQYRCADVIGVQTPGNIAYFSGPGQAPRARIEVLHNWLAPAVPANCSIRVADTVLAGRRIFVYAGNMGVAQGMDIILALAASLADHSDIGFLFVGRGSETRRLREQCQRQGLGNVLFRDEIDPDEIPGLYAQCDVGIVALDSRHRTHNIPGKFLTYMQAGLPVLASVNEGNDLVALINSEQVGQTCTTHRVEDLRPQALALVKALRQGSTPFPARCRSLSDRMFSASAAARQVVDSLSAVGQ